MDNTNINSDIRMKSVEPIAVLLGTPSLEWRNVQKCYLSIEQLQILGIGSYNSSTILCHCRESQRIFVAKVFPSFEGLEINFPTLMSTVEMRKYETSHEYILSEPPSNNRDSICSYCVIPSDEMVRFKSISVDVYLDDIRYEKSELIKYVEGILQTYTFSSDCIIHVGSSNLVGIKKINVKQIDTMEKKLFGTLHADGRVVVANWYKFSCNISSYDTLKIERAEVKYLKEIIEQTKSYFLHENQLTENRIKPPLSLLLNGTTGSGRRSLVYNEVVDHRINLIMINSSNLIWRDTNEVVKHLNDIFSSAKRFANYNNNQLPSLILLHEVNCLNPPDDNNKAGINYLPIIRTLNELMIDIHQCTVPIMIIATTSATGRNPHLNKFLSSFRSEIQIQKLNVETRGRLLTKAWNRINKTCQEIDRFLVEQLSPILSDVTGRNLVLLINEMYRLVAKKNCDSNMESVTKNKLIECYNQAAKIINLPILDLKTIDDTYEYKQNKFGFDKIIGYHKVKLYLNNAIIRPMNNKEVYRKFGLKPFRGILLYGPPGCAKTTLAQCISSEAKMKFISASCADIYSPYVGVAEKNLVALFEEARQSSPSVLFLDEIDVIIGSRDKENNDVQSRLIATLLTEMDGITKLSSDNINDSNLVIVIAATNRPQSLDPAVVRPGRFDRMAYMTAPNQEDRYQILCSLSANFHVENIDYNLLASRTENFSGADLKSLCVEAALLSLSGDFKNIKITQESFNAALNAMKPSLTSDQIKFYDNFNLNN